MNQPLKIPFGLKYNRLVTVDEVESGLACGCICPACGSLLQAKKGLNAHHFAHDPSSNKTCTNGLETSIHKMAKQIIAEEKTIYLPRRSLLFSGRNRSGNGVNAEISIVPDTKPTFDEVVLEERRDDFQPDIIATINNIELFIEISVTHPVNKEKLAKIQQNGVSTIEVRISERNLTKAKLKDLLLNQLSNKHWLFHRDDNEGIRAGQRKLNKLMGIKSQ